MNLILSLLVGEGRRRIVFLLKPQGLNIDPLPRLAGIYVRGFSAGSFVGLSLLHLLWQWNTVHAGGVLGAIACPSSLLDCIPVERMDNIVLLHYYSDRLCVWRPVDGHPLARRTVYVEGDWRLVNHLGAQEHNYSHWLDNVPGAGQHQLWRLLLASPAMANPHKRDASALRLLSWLSFSLDKRTSALLAKLMKQLTITEVTNPAVLQIASESEIGGTWTNLMQVRTGLIDQVSISNLSLPSEAVIELYRTFLARLSLPRLVHFLDLVLPQMHPHQQVKDRNDIRQLTSHYLSLHGQDGSGCSPPVLMNFLFHSHAGLVHILVEWFKHPLLVFSDYPRLCPLVAVCRGRVFDRLHSAAVAIKPSQPRKTPNQHCATEPSTFGNWMINVRAHRARRKTGLCEDYKCCCAYALDSLQPLFIDNQEVAAQIHKYPGSTYSPADKC